MPEVKSAEMTFSRVYRDAAIHSKAMIPLLCVVFLINTVPMVYADLNWSETDSNRLAGLFGIINLLFQFLIVKRILQFNDQNQASNRNFVPRMFGIQIVYFLAVGLGFICFIFPGIYIALRWSLAVPAMIAGDKSIADSIEESWKLTDGKFIGLLLISLPIFALFGAAVAFVFVSFEQVDPIIYMTIFESLASFAIMVPWIVFPLIYIRLSKFEREKT